MSFTDVATGDARRILLHIYPHTIMLGVLILYGSRRSAPRALDAHCYATLGSLVPEASMRSPVKSPRKSCSPVKSPRKSSSKSADTDRSLLGDFPPSAAAAAHMPS